MTHVLVPANEEKIHVVGRRVRDIYEIAKRENKSSVSGSKKRREADEELDRQIRLEACRLGLIASEQQPSNGRKREFAVGATKELNNVAANDKKQLPRWVVLSVWSLYHIDLRVDDKDPLPSLSLRNQRLCSFDPVTIQPFSNQPDESGRENYQLQLTHLKMEDIDGYLTVGEHQYRMSWRIGRCELHIEAANAEIGNVLVHASGKSERANAVHDCQLDLNGEPKKGLPNPVTGRIIGNNCTSVNWTLTTTKQVTASALLNRVHLCDLTVTPNSPISVQLAFGPDSFRLELNPQVSTLDESSDERTRRQLFAQALRNLAVEKLALPASREPVRLAEALDQGYLSKSVFKAPCVPL